ncbi:FAD/NAD(P)-binding protein [Chryseobacterium sp. c4a]|uniref:FAD/NAD(P)-binding protein n=1 Tax=Chryseobacterium sp. c4a TaxID=1573582 RepID=UPI00135CC807|nr:FAD/NAD(P)-binding protein [Chryseobacterium sp. c4a]
MNIAIIGAGPAGIITATAIYNKVKDKHLSIDLYDFGTPFRGRSFNTHSANMLLNTSVGVSFIDPDNPDGFIDYINKNKKLQIQPGDVVSRDLAVCFLESEFTLAKKNGANANFYKETVNDISLHHSGQLSVIHNKQTICYDSVIITTGLQFSPPPAIVRHKNIISPYPATNLTEINKMSSVLILGSRLSAVDTLVHLEKNGHKGPIDVYSQSQLFPSVRHHVIKPSERLFLEQYQQAVENLPNNYSRITCFLDMFKDYLLKKGMVLRDIIAVYGNSGGTQLEQDIRNCQENRNIWENILMDLIDGLNYVWPSLPSEDKTRFNKEVNPWFGRIAHSMPLCNAHTVLKLFHNNQLMMLSSGELLTADMNKYDVVVNATGLQSAENDVLLSSLSKKNLLTFNGNGGVQIDECTHRLRNDIPIYANGSIVQGDVFTANSIYSTSYGARKIAIDIEKIFKNTIMEH